MAPRPTIPATEKDALTAGVQAIRDASPEQLVEKAREFAEAYKAARKQYSGVEDMIPQVSDAIISVAKTMDGRASEVLDQTMEAFGAVSGSMSNGQRVLFMKKAAEVTLKAIDSEPLLKLHKDAERIIPNAEMRTALFDTKYEDIKKEGDKLNAEQRKQTGSAGDVGNRVGNILPSIFKYAEYRNRPDVYDMQAAYVENEIGLPLLRKAEAIKKTVPPVREVLTEIKDREVSFANRALADIGLTDTRLDWRVVGALRTIESVHTFEKQLDAFDDIEKRAKKTLGEPATGEKKATGLHKTLEDAQRQHDRFSAFQEKMVEDIGSGLSPAAIAKMRKRHESALSSVSSGGSVNVPQVRSFVEAMKLSIRAENGHGMTLEADNDPVRDLAKYIQESPLLNDAEKKTIRTGKQWEAVETYTKSLDSLETRLNNVLKLCDRCEKAPAERAAMQERHDHLLHKAGSVMGQFTNAPKELIKVTHRLDALNKEIDGDTTSPSLNQRVADECKSIYTAWAKTSPTQQVMQGVLQSVAGAVDTQAKTRDGATREITNIGTLLQQVGAAKIAIAPKIEAEKAKRAGNPITTQGDIETNLPDVSETIQTEIAAGEGQGR
jgi:hypothetical protein